VSHLLKSYSKALSILVVNHSKITAVIAIEERTSSWSRNLSQ